MRAVTSAPAGRADLGVYLHFPFCERVCPYCDFAVEAAPRRAPLPESRWLELVLRELALAREAFGPDLAGRRLATVYLGGGTPSLLTPASVERLLAALFRDFEGPADEVTLELNPGTAEVERIPGYRRAGVTRLSVGVQSLQDLTLRRLGRAHRGREARRGLEAALDAGFDSVSADLIFAAPEQAEAGLLADVGVLIDLGVPHVSAYALTLEPGTPFGAGRARLRLPDEDTALRMGGRLRAELIAAGYEHYEISNFARPGHRSRHNQRYWRREDVLGLGPAAASLVGGLRTRNAGDRSSWEAALAAGRLAWAERELLGPAEERRETLYLGLRCLSGIARADYLRRFGAPPEAHFAAELAELRELELIRDEAGRLCLSERGILFADEVFLRFVALTRVAARH